jgi:cyclopropane fatty-acyl-phospholipid synthase-like methyltransferase
VSNALRIAHVGLAFASPVSEAAVDAAIAALPLPSGPLVLDTGCGSGEMLLRTLRSHAPARGLGIDLDADAIAEARQRANGLLRQQSRG